MRDTPQRPDGKPGAHVTVSSLFVRVNVVAILVAGAGLFLPRVTAGGLGLTTVRTGYGHVFVLLLLVVGAILACWSLARADRLTGALLFVAWLGLLALAVFEVVRVSSALGDRFGLADVGVGLYCNVAGAAMGTVAALVAAMGQWSAPAADRTRPWAWVAAGGAIVLTLAAVGASGQLAGRGELAQSALGGFVPRSSFVIGAHDGSRNSDASPVEGRRSMALPSPTSTAAPSVVSGSEFVAGAIVGTGGSGGTGDTGNSGSWEMGVGLADYWPGYTGTPGSFYIWPGYLGPATNTGVTGGSGPTVTGASGLTGSGAGTGTGTGTGPVPGTGTTTTTTTTVTTTTTTTPPSSGSNTFPPPNGSGSVTH